MAQPASVTTRAFRYNVAAPGANTNILATNVAPRGWGAKRSQAQHSGASKLVLTLCLEDASVVDLFTTDGTTTFRSKINEGTPFPADAPLSLKIPVHPSISYNFSLQTNVAIRWIQVDEEAQGAG